MQPCARYLCELLNSLEIILALLAWLQLLAAVGRVAEHLSQQQEWSWQCCGAEQSSSGGLVNSPCHSAGLQNKVDEEHFRALQELSQLCAPTHHLLLGCHSFATAGTLPQAPQELTHDSPPSNSLPGDLLRGPTLVFQLPNN